jgi:hypothetical protein
MEKKKNFSLTLPHVASPPDLYGYVNNVMWASSDYDLLTLIFPVVCGDCHPKNDLYLEDETHG